MKPTYHISQQPKRVDGDLSPAGSRRIFPLTDYNFHGNVQDVRSAQSVGRKLSRPVLARGFRDLSNEFLASETKRSYAIELLFFTIIVAVSTWPILLMADAIAKWIR